MEPKAGCASPFQPQYDGNSAFLLFDDESDGEEEEELMDEDEEEDSEISGCGGWHSGWGGVERSWLR